MITFVVLVIFGFVTATIAANKGRSFIAWLFIGFFLGLIGLIMILVVADLAEEKRAKEREIAERRRLEEMLRQEKLKNEVFREYTSNRIDAHDHQLGVSTRNNPGHELGQGNPAQGNPAQGYIVQGQQGRPAQGNHVQGQQGRPAQGNHVQGQSSAQGSPPVASEKWYYASNGETIGPFNAAHIKNLYFEGKLTSATQLWLEGTPKWVPMGSFLERY